MLIGGGHSHVVVLKRFAMKPLPGLRITLITRDIHTPYSGMLPGHIAGFYDYDECHIDLGPLAQMANARLIHARVDQLDVENQKVHCDNHPPLHFDVLSINTGSTPDHNNIDGVDEFALAVKPIDVFLKRWQVLKDQIVNQEPEQTHRIVIVGGGAGGVETALSTQYKLKQDLLCAGHNPDVLKFTLLSASEHIMHQHNVGVRRRFERILDERKIQSFCNKRVSSIDRMHVYCSDGSTFEADHVIWATHASSQGWIGVSGLEVDDKGFLMVNQQLQSMSHGNIFSAGDIAALPSPRPKSGVFAVRQGPVLADNLRAAALQKPLKKYRAQKNFLGLISTGNKYAVASRGDWSYESALLWRIKDWIDRRFMQKFNDLPEMQPPKVTALSAAITDDETYQALTSHAMRCGGCGAKVGSTVLTRVMQRLPSEQRKDVLIGRDQADDCAMIEVPAGKLLVQSVDYFRAFINDSYTFGAITANHALGDLYAMGAEPQSALAIATLPFASESIIEEELYHLLSGALSVLQPSGAVLAGGHSSEGNELAFGLTVNGLVQPDQVLRKQGLSPGDLIILTKPIGTGTLFAAQMQAKAKGRWIDGAIQCMLQSNQKAAACLIKNQASACTDLTGFGLAGHLWEMLQASQVDAEIYLDQLPLLDGSLETVKAGILSSLQPQNLRLRRIIKDTQSAKKHPAYPLLFDPQTAGGLLVGIPNENSEQCIQQLQQLGYQHAVVIGQVKALSVAQPILSIL